MWWKTAWRRFTRRPYRLLFQAGWLWLDAVRRKQRAYSCSEITQSRGTSHVLGSAMAFMAGGFVKQQIHVRATEAERLIVQGHRCGRMQLLFVSEAAARTPRALVTREIAEHGAVGAVLDPLLRGKSGEGVVCHQVVR